MGKLEAYELMARAFIAEKANSLHFKTVILDDWSGIRLIYDTEEVQSCVNRCETCRMYLVLGKDQKNRDLESLTTTLTDADHSHTDVSTNRMLNCKTVENYLESFVQWMLKRCRTVDEYKQELELVRDFRIVHHPGWTNNSASAKQEMVTKVLRKVREGISADRREIFEKAVKAVFETPHQFQPESSPGPVDTPTP